MKLKAAILLICIALCHTAPAQNSVRAVQWYNAALKLKAEKKEEKACKKMERAIAKEPSFPEPYSVLGQWYFHSHKFAEAANVFRRASANCKDGHRRFAKPLANSLIYALQPSEALSIISTHGIGAADRAEWDKMRSQAAFMLQALMKPWVHEPVSLGVRINTVYPELFPSMAVDTQTLYFTRQTNNQDEDFFRAFPDSCGGWFSAHNMGEPANTPNPEYAQFISADGHYLFLTRCDNRSLDEWTDGGCDLFMAYRTTNASDWTVPQPFGATINTPDYEGMPTVSPDSRELYFVSNRPGGYGGYDIWVSSFENGLWQEPVNAGPTINSAGNETAPYVNIDNQTLYFTSDGWPGMGGNDLFMSRRNKQGKWEQATNMGYPLNTPFEEKSAFVSFDGMQLYLASDRKGPPGNYDIYEAPLPSELRPTPSSYIQGYVYDSLTQKRLPSANMYITNAGTGDTIYHFRSNRGDASYVIPLPVGHMYLLHAAHVGYDRVMDTFVFDKQYLQQPMRKDVPLLINNYEDIKPIKDTMVARLHFDVNIVALSPTDKAAIRDAMAPWLSVKNITVYVNAYTDNTGTPMINEGLSYKRADIVAKEIYSLGIDEHMVQAQGLGEANTIASNDTEEGRKLNRRVEIFIKR
jgi:outer membrane protein OmpA-like peptidoglycan-associated protein